MSSRERDEELAAILLEALSMILPPFLRPPRLDEREWAIKEIADMLASERGPMLDYINELEQRCVNLTPIVRERDALLLELSRLTALLHAKQN